LIALVFKRKSHVEEVGIISQPEEAEKPSMFAGIKEKLQSLTKKKEKAEVEEAPAEFEGFEEEEDITDPGAAAPPPAAADDQPVDATVFEAPSPPADAGGVEDMMFEEDESQPSPDMTQDAEVLEPAAEQPAGPDPLEEVDVYEAFGDFEQAAEIVNQAIADFPDNNSYKLRLFKVYESGGMKDEFSQAAVDHKDAMADSPEWGEVEQMGKVFAPDSPAWGGSGGADATPFQSVAQPASAAGEDMAATMAMDSSTAAEVSESSVEVDAGDTNEIDFGDLDFELGSTTDEQPIVEPSDDVAAMDMENTQALDDSANVAVAAGGDQPEVEFDMDSMDFETTGEPEGVSEPAAEETPDEADAGLEFDLGDFGDSLEAEPEQPAAQEPETDIGNELEFDLGDMGMEPQAVEEEATETVAVDSDADDMSMDFELDDVSDTPAVSDTPTAELQDSSDTVALNISADELEAAASVSEPEPTSEDPTVMFTEEASADEGAEPEESIGVDLSDFSFDLDDTGESEALDIETEGSEAETVMLGDADDSLGEGLSAEGDEVATKLDLARAYIDMGDSEGAKGILEEVVAEGNDAQKAEAQELLQST